MTNEEGRAVCQDGAGLKAEVLRCVVRLILITGIKREMADLVGTWLGETHPARYKYERRQSLGLRKVAHFHSTNKYREATLARETPLAKRGCASSRVVVAGLASRTPNLRGGRRACDNAYAIGGEERRCRGCLSLARCRTTLRRHLRHRLAARRFSFKRGGVSAPPHRLGISLPCTMQLQHPLEHGHGT